MPNQIQDRVLGEVEKHSFIALPSEGDTAGCHPQNSVCHPERFGDEFYSNGSRAVLLIRIRVCEGPAFLYSGGFPDELLWFTMLSDCELFFGRKNASLTFVNLLISSFVNEECLINTSVCRGF